MVQSAQLLANLVPDDEKLIGTSHISFVKQGQAAKISFSAYDAGIYGTFEGEVFEVGATTTKGGDPDNANVYYDTRIMVTDNTEILLSSLQ